ncbi:hypothetical protein D3C76_1328960 [compost metagenome]
MLMGTVLTLVFALSEARLIGLVAGMALSLFGLGVCETTLMSLAMASQDRALGSTAALLGAFQLVISSSSTPLAGVAVERGVVEWALLLVLSALLVWGLTWLTTRRTDVASNSVTEH